MGASELLKHALTLSDKERLTDGPNIYRCRRYILHQFPFSIVYKVRDEDVLALAVAHGHRSPGYWRRRLSQ